MDEKPQNKIIKVMGIIELISNGKNLLSNSNEEWRNFVNLSALVQEDFKTRNYLSFQTFGKILNWRLQNQKSNIQKILDFSSEALIKSITKCYFEVSHPNEELDLKIKIHVLLSIPWIGIGVASSIMSFHEPKKYASIDANSWSIIFQKEKKALSAKDYIDYLKKIQQISKELNISALEIDYILFKQVAS